MAKPPKMTALRLLQDVLKDPDRKSVYTIITEILSLSSFRRGFPRYYFSRFLFKKGRLNIKDYSSASFLYKIKPFFNEHDLREVLENKLYFDFFFRQFKISLPNIIMYNFRKMFVVGNVRRDINTPNEFKMLLAEIFRLNSSYNSIFIKKTYWSFGGDRVYKIFPDQINGDTEMINRLYFEVIESGFLFQETLIQHPDLNILNPSCINTLRLDTFIDRDGHIEIISGHMRMSISNLHVDNVGSGGCAVSIDLNKGKLRKEGYLPFKTCGVTILKAHPITNTIFEDFSIPFFTEAKELVIRAASFIPGLRLVGWDVAITSSGPIIIEGNSDYDMSGNDLVDGGYLANPVFRKVLAEINYL
jgi:hypothetical protein